MQVVSLGMRDEMSGGRDQGPFRVAVATLHVLMQAHERMNLGSTKAQSDDVSGLERLSHCGELPADSGFNFHGCFLF